MLPRLPRAVARPRSSPNRVQIASARRCRSIALVWSPPVSFATAKRNELALKRLDHLARMRHETRSLPDSPAVASSATG